MSDERDQRPSLDSFAHTPGKVRPSKDAAFVVAKHNAHWPNNEGTLGAAIKTPFLSFFFFSVRHDTAVKKESG
jgi:hypothetical protein